MSGERVPAPVPLPTPTPHEPASVEPGARASEPAAAGVPVGVRSAALTIIAILALILVLQYAQAMIIPIVLGVLISYALYPVVTALTRMRIPRPIAAGVLLITLVGGGGLLLYQLRFQAQAIAEQLPDGARRLRRTIETNRQGSGSTIGQVQQAATELERAADNAGSAPAARSGVQRVQVETAPIDISQYIVYGSLGLAAAAGQLVLVLFLSYFLLASGDMYRRKMVKIVGPSLAQKRVTVQILQEIDRQIESYLLVQIGTSALVGVASWLAFVALGLHQAAMWGLLAGVFNSIPYFGPVIVTCSIALITFLQFGTLEMVLIIAGAALAITTLEGLLLTPLLSSRAARMNAVAVFVGLIFWGWVWEVWGLLLAVPMLVVIKSVCDHVDEFKGFGELLGD
ncbi:MAG: AI-2E family transporter [Luteitalea sp.]|nr:AI-2E family transporter [Luteitalea sp.]